MDKEKWKSIQDALPKEKALVLVTNGKLIGIATWVKKSFEGIGPSFPEKEITLWRNLPGLPTRPPHLKNTTKNRIK